MIDAELVFNDRNGYLVVIMSNVVQRLCSYRQLSFFSKESAGIFIGERRGSHLVICDLSEPGPGDICSRYSVDRRGMHHQAKVNEAFIRSKGILQYLGEWHTHPEDNPRPSFKDEQSWKGSIDAALPMIVLIVGRKSLWVGRKEDGIITPLVQQTSNVL